MRESDATWKVLISPTPLVGSDRGGKNDNHATEGFRHEGAVNFRAYFLSDRSDICDCNLATQLFDRYPNSSDSKPKLQAK